MKKYFVMVVDNEVAGNFPVPQLELPDGSPHPTVEKLQAILSSDPKIIPSEIEIPEGWTWDGTNFHKVTG